MPIGKINFGPSQESGSEELSGASPVAMNVVIDGKGAVRRRPGLTQFGSVTGLGGDVIGMYVDLHGEIFLYVKPSEGAQQRVYRVNPSGAGVTDVSDVLELVGSLRPTFAETEAMLVIADGVNTLKWTFASSLLERLGGDPPVASHIIANSSRLLANNINELLGQVNYSALSIGDETAGNETWDGDSPGADRAGSFVGEARPDPVVALAENTNEVYLFGKTTVQVYGPDASYTYAPISTREKGTCAPYSVVKVDQVFAWLDNERRFILGDGRSTKVISDPIQQTLDNIVVFDDCYGARVSTGPIDCILWSFPTDGRTFCYQLNGGWSQWSGRDPVTNAWIRFLVSSLYMDPAGGRILAGTSDGRVGTLDFSSLTDLGDPIWAFVDTGFTDYGTDRKKRCKGFRAAFRRTGIPTSDTVLLSWRDDLGPFCAPIEFELGVDGDTIPDLVVRSLGVYRRRQWRLQFSGTGEFVLARAEEEYEILEQ